MRTVKWVTIGGILTFMTFLGLTVGERMSTDAMAVMIGVIVGVAGSIPTSLLLTTLLVRSRANVNLPAQPPTYTQPQIYMMQAPPVQGSGPLYERALGGSPAVLDAQPAPAQLPARSNRIVL